MALRPVHISGFAQLPNVTEDARIDEAEMVLAATRGALEQAGIGRHDVGFVCSGSNDYAMGRPFSFTMALDGVGPDELRIPRLKDRVLAEGITEVILALNATVDGQTTAHYIADQFEGQVRLTSLAQGVPIGGELDYLDDGTITTALRSRK